MSLQSTALALLAAAVIAGPAAASTESKPLVCPDTAARMTGLDQKLEQLQARLEALDDTLQSVDDVRREAIDNAKVRIEEAVRHAELSQDQVDAVVARVLTDAQRQGEAAAKAAASARQAMDQVKIEMQSLEHEMHALQLHEDSDEGDATHHG